MEIDDIAAIKERVSAQLRRLTWTREQNPVWAAALASPEGLPKTA